MLEALKHELASYLGAAYPFVALRTHEEDRALAILRAVAQTTGHAVQVWSLPRLRHDEPDATAETVIERVRAHADRALFVLLDFHAWLDDPLVRRALRDLRAQLERRGQTVVFVSAAFEPPTELEGDVVLLDLPLPDAVELRHHLARTAERLGLTLERDHASRLVRAAQGLTAQAAMRGFRRVLSLPDAEPARQATELVQEKRRLLRQSDLLEFLDTPPDLGDVGGLDHLKEWLVDRAAAFDDRAREFGLPVPKGLLLVGVQGCGKSLTAKAVARLWDLPIARLDFGALFTFGQSPEQNLRRVIRLAEALAPVVLWIDEIDKAFQHIGDASSDALSRIFAAFITWLQEKTSSVFVVATANTVDHLPAELLRKGRFDEIFFFDLPSVHERAQILAIHLRAHGRDPSRHQLEPLATACEHFSGAELEQVVIAALYRAFQKGRDLLDEDLLLAAKATVPLFRTAEEPIKRLREWASARARRASTDARLVELWAAPAPKRSPATP